MLRFLRRQIGYRIKKRTFVVLALSVLTTAVVAVILSMVAVWLAGPADILRVVINEPSRRVDILGTGINLQQVSPDNLLNDPSFEPVAFRKLLTVYDGDVHSLTVVDHTLDQAFYSDGFFTGATARILSNGPEGLSLKKSTTVSAYHTNRVGSFQMVQLPADLPPGREILGFADNGEVSLAVGKAGLILYDLAKSQPTIVDSNTQSDLTDVTVVNKGFLAGSERGQLFYSQDGQSWQEWPVTGNQAIRAVAASEEGLIVAVGDGGQILAGSAGLVSPAVSLIKSNLIDLVYGNGLFLALAEDGTVIRSSNGSLWRKVEHPVLNGQLWRAVAFADGVFALGGENGQVAISEDGLNFNLTPSSPAVQVSDLLMLSRNQMIVLGRDSRFRYSSNGGHSWSESAIDPGMASRRLDVLGNRQVVSADESGQIGIAPLVIEMTLSQPLVSGAYSAGDLLFLELSSQSVRTPDSWEIFGAGQSERMSLSVPDEGGEASLYLAAPDTAAPDAPVILSQSIDSSRFARRNESDIYTLELWMRQEKIQEASVRIWLSGDFQSIGTTIDHVGSTWKKYSHTFVIPKNLVAHSQSLRFNISFSGPGELWLDQIFLGQPSQGLRGVDAAYIGEIESAQPSVLRLEFLPMGSSSQTSFQWAKLPGNEAAAFQDGEWEYVGGQSLASALELARKARSQPWLVIEPGMSETELLGLCEYLAGSITSNYGHLRMTQGEILPWIESFDRVYLEFSDSDPQLQSDGLRTSWVDWMIDVIQQSPFYNEMKNKLVFVDGLSYTDGVWSSGADYHSSQLIGLYQGNNQNGVQPALASYFDQLPRNPAKPRQDWHEIISMASLHGFENLQPTLADLVHFQMEELGKSAGLVNLDLREPWDKEYRAQDAIAARLTGLPPDSHLLEAISPDSDLKVYAYAHSTGVRIYLANLSTVPKSVRMTGDREVKGFLLSGYDQNGDLLRERRLASSRETFNILPGGVAVLDG